MSEAIFNIYDKKSQRAKDEADARSKEVWEKDKRIKEIDDELASIGMKVFRASLLDDEKREAEYKRLENSLALLRAERADRLLALGLPSDYTNPHYECEKCSDTGYIGFKACDCLKKEIVKENYKKSGIGKYLEKQTFSNFDLSYYGEGKTRENMKFILERAKRYAEGFNKNTSESFLFLGGTGLGKTHLSSAIAKVVIEKGFSVSYDSAQNIISAFEKERFMKEGETPLTDRYFSADLLIIDDLGAEVHSKNSVSYFYTLINTRLIAGKPVIVSTNLTGSSLQSQYESRIVSRLLGEYTVSVFTGEDVRKIKK